LGTFMPAETVGAVKTGQAVVVPQGLPRVYRIENWFPPSIRLSPSSSKTWPSLTPVRNGRRRKRR
jgi:hypothetical protein